MRKPTEKKAIAMSHILRSSYTCQVTFRVLFYLLTYAEILITAVQKVINLSPPLCCTWRCVASACPLTNKRRKLSVISSQSVMKNFLSFFSVRSCVNYMDMEDKQFYSVSRRQTATSFLISKQRSPHHYRWTDATQFSRTFSQFTTKLFDEF